MITIFNCAAYIQREHVIQRTTTVVQAAVVGMLERSQPHCYRTVERRSSSPNDYCTACITPYWSPSQVSGPVTERGLDMLAHKPTNSNGYSYSYVVCSICTTLKNAVDGAKAASKAGAWE